MGRNWLASGPNRNAKGLFPSLNIWTSPEGGFLFYGDGPRRLSRRDTARFIRTYRANGWRFWLDLEA